MQIKGEQLVEDIERFMALCAKPAIPYALRLLALLSTHSAQHNEVSVPDVLCGSDCLQRIFTTALARQFLPLCPVFVFNFYPVIDSLVQAIRW